MFPKANHLMKAQIKGTKGQSFYEGKCFSNLNVFKKAIILPASCDAGKTTERKSWIFIDRLITTKFHFIGWHSSFHHRRRSSGRTKYK
jgi:hypothetical protein